MSQRPSLSDRLLARNNGPGLSRQSMADGGAVYSGPTASRALQTLGARAMTMDGSIFVGEGFDASRPQDAALYAHERLHQAGSGGEGPNSGHDAEEIAARAMEAMVLHRAEAGEDPTALLQQAAAGGLPAAVTPALADQKSPDNAASSWMGYLSMRTAGQSHAQVVQQLAQKVIRAKRDRDEAHNTRTGGEG